MFSNFSEARHNRFLDDGTINPNYVLDHGRITGVAVEGVVLISPQHYLTSSFSEVIDPTFVTADGTRRTYTANVSSKLVLKTTLQNDFDPGDGTTLLAGSVHDSDLVLVTLDHAISAADGISPMALLSGDYYDMLGRTMIVQGQNSQAGSDTIDYIQTIKLNPVVENGADGELITVFPGAITESFVYRWDELAGGGSNDEIRLEEGDSGIGSLVDLGDKYAVTGANMGVGTFGSSVFNFNSFVTPYLDQIEAQVNADGFAITTMAVAVPEPATPLVLVVLVGLAWQTNRRRTRRQLGSQ
ncbi:PEP-CTERM sorting domain-containing protein [Neorhodopirellula lusitana]|uniref:PEP-CTERM sorting domain-containing protein n=1 Tax=Neorhodopirellula lusitana TaxID=445327 RepID=UPI0024B823A6|nr:PEP-CTERM sorting domain-containing protein [Neorhodopirellula lusitana]